MRWRPSDLLIQMKSPLRSAGSSHTEHGCLAGFFKRGEGDVALLDHLDRDGEFLQALLAGQVVHKVEHEFFEDHAQAASANLAVEGFASDSSQGIFVEVEFHVLELKHALVLLGDSVARAREDLDECVLIEFVEHAHHGQAADEFGDEPELDQVLRLSLLEHLGVAAVRGNIFFLLLLAGLEAERFLANTATDDALESDEGATHDKEDVSGVDRSEFLVRMFASALRRNVGDGTFENLKQGLLHAFAADIAGDGRVLVLAADLVDFVDVDDASLGAGDIAFGGLEQLEDDVLDVLADVTGFGERGGV